MNFRVGEDAGATDGRNVLVTAPDDAAGVLSGAGGRSDGDTHVVGVIADQGVEEWLGARDGPQGTADQVSVVSLGEDVRSTAAASGGGPAAAPGVPRIVPVSSPASLATLGEELTGLLSGAPDDANVVVDVAALDAILAAVPVEKAFSFLHALTRLVESRGATARYRVSPDAHDEETIRTLEPLFDAHVA